MPKLVTLILFPGTVIESLQRKFPQNQKIFAAKVFVRRVFKGPKLLQDKFVIVENLGNPRICMSKPKVKDTRLFFTDPLMLEDYHYFGSPRTPHFKLRSSLLRLTLSNLRILWHLDSSTKGTKKGKSISVTNFYKMVLN